MTGEKLDVLNGTKSYSFGKSTSTGFPSSFVECSFFSFLVAVVLPFSDQEFYHFGEMVVTFLKDLGTKRPEREHNFGD